MKPSQRDKLDQKDKPKNLKKKYIPVAHHNNQQSQYPPTNQLPYHHHHHHHHHNQIKPRYSFVKTLRRLKFGFHLTAKLYQT